MPGLRGGTALSDHHRRVATAGDRLRSRGAGRWRRPVPIDLRRGDPGQDRPRPADAQPGRQISGLRLAHQRRLWHRGAPGRAPGPGPDQAPPPHLRPAGAADPLVVSPPQGFFAALRMTVAGIMFAASGLAAQQTNAERILSGRDTPSHDYDLIHQRIEVRNFDWDATAFDGLVTTTVVSMRPGLDSIVLDMGRRLAVRSITVNCAPCKSARPPVRLSAHFARPGDSLVVRLPKPAGFRDTVRFTVDYRGKIRQGRGLYFFKAEPDRPHRPQQIYIGSVSDCNTGLNST